jgi:hypothetical protein
MWRKEEQGNHVIPKNHSCQCTCWILLMMMHDIWILEYQCIFLVNMNGSRIWKNPSYGISFWFWKNSIQEVVLNKRKVMVSLKIGERKYMPSRPTCFTSTISLINEETFMKWMFVEQNLEIYSIDFLVL